MPVVLWTALALAQLGLAAASIQCEQECETKCETQCKTQVATKCDSACKAECKAERDAQFVSKCESKCESACASECESKCESARATTVQRSAGAGWFELTLKGNFPVPMPVGGPGRPHYFDPQFVHEMMPGPMPHWMPHPAVGHMPPGFPCPMNALAPMPGCDLFEALFAGHDGPCDGLCNGPCDSPCDGPEFVGAPPFHGQHPLVVGFHPWSQIVAAIRHLEAQRSECQRKCETGQCSPCPRDGQQSTVHVGTCPTSSKCSQDACCTKAGACPTGSACESCPAEQPTGDCMVLSFGAGWCGPCQQMAPIVARLQRQGLPIRKVDVDEEKELARKCGVSSIPAFVRVQNGEPCGKIVGVTTETRLRELAATGEGGYCAPACAKQQRTVVCPTAGHCTAATAAAYPGASKVKVVNIVDVTYPVPQAKAELLAKLLAEHCGVAATCDGDQIQVATSPEKQRIVAQFVSGIVQTAQTTASSTAKPIALQARPSECRSDATSLTPYGSPYDLSPATCPTASRPACAQQCESNDLDMNVRATKGRIEIECHTNDGRPRRFRLVTDGGGVRLEEQCPDGSIQQTSGSRLEMHLDGQGLQGLFGDRLHRIFRLGTSEE